MTRKLETTKSQRVESLEPDFIDKAELARYLFCRVKGDRPMDCGGQLVSAVPPTGKEAPDLATRSLQGFPGHRGVTERCLGCVKNRFNFKGSRVPANRS
jgi:hypothetical protein